MGRIWAGIGCLAAVMASHPPNGYRSGMYDIIGDIHGHADELVELLTRLGYREDGGCFRHEKRRAIFCGDFIDRGPQIPDVVRIARSMVENDAARAVMGNHEFNALAYYTEHPEAPGEFLRRHDSHNDRQHAATRQQFDDAELQSSLEWFGTLPVALDLTNLRIVHACWNPEGIAAINRVLSTSESAFSPEFLVPATNRGSELFDAVECVLKGPELPLPDGETVKDKEGNIRRRIRIRWFEPPDEHSWDTYSLPLKPTLPSEPVPANAPAVPYSKAEPPVFVGHYWLPDKSPAPLTRNIACLDYSVARNGFLTAYRFDGESVLATL